MRIQFIYSPGGYPGFKAPAQEYPLFDKDHLCPTSRYVGGTSKYLCECDRPSTCPGVIAVVETYYPDQITEE